MQPLQNAVLDAQAIATDSRNVLANLQTAKRDAAFVSQLHTIYDNAIVSVATKVGLAFRNERLRILAGHDVNGVIGPRGSGERFPRLRLGPGIRVVTTRRDEINIFGSEILIQGIGVLFEVRRRRA